MAKNQAVRVRREAVAACITCPLCSNLLREATTISECLHTFCRKCIYKKIADEELECCPICNIDLGSVPLEKLRPDHNLQDVRVKIFPLKKGKVKATETQAVMTLPTRRKERSLSSLVVNAPKVSSRSPLASRRTKSATRKVIASQVSSFIEKLDKEEESTEEHLGPSGEPSQTKSDPRGETTNGTWEGKSDLWKPLHDLVEAANRTKSFKCSSKVLDGSRAQGNENHQQQNKMKGSKSRSRVNRRRSNSDPASSEVIKPKRLRRIRPEKVPSFGESHISLQAVLDAAAFKHDMRAGPIWFSLVASEEQEGDEPLLQVPTCYLRIKDGNLPVSFIQKYLVKKLQLGSETEVEIKCLGQTLLPTLLLYNLVDLWLQAAPTSQRVPTITGSSAKDFIMVLTYSRKAPDC